MSQSNDESKSDDRLGISDDQLPEDLVPSEDNPLAEGLPDGEAPHDVLTDGKGAEGDEDDSADDDRADDDRADQDQSDAADNADSGGSDDGD